MVTLWIDDAALDWLKPASGRGRSDRIRELVADATTFFGLPEPVRTVLRGDMQALGVESQRDYVLNLLLTRARELGVPAMVQHTESEKGSRSRFCCLFPAGTRARAGLGPGRKFAGYINAIISDARSFYGVSPRVQAALVGDMKAQHIDTQREYVVWLILLRAGVRVVELKRGPAVGRVA